MMPKIKSYWTTSQNRQQIQNMSTRKVLRKGGERGSKRELMLVTKKIKIKAMSFCHVSVQQIHSIK